MDKFKEALCDNLDTFSRAVNLSLILYDTNGTELKTFGEMHSYCAVFRNATGKYCPCGEMHRHACMQAADLGEAYIFPCPAGLVHFVVPVYRRHSLIASVLAEPILLEYPDISIVDEAVKRYGLSLEWRSRLYSALGTVQMVEPSRFRYLSKLLFLQLHNLTAEPDADPAEILSEKNMQQSEIAEYLRVIRDSPVKPDGGDALPAGTSGYDLEQMLLSDILSGNESDANAVLNEMLGRIYFASGNNIEIIKVKVIELISFLSRALVNRGTGEQTIYEMTDAFLHKLPDYKNLTDLSYGILVVLREFTDFAFSDTDRNTLPVIKKAIRYMNEHYCENPRLEQVASYAGLNPAYFSTLFKKKTGSNFSAYLNDLKLARARQLLKRTNLPLSAIAAELGFDSQSHFSTVFRKANGMTPRQYRDHL